jgi:hypothetical protein
MLDSRGHLFHLFAKNFNIFFEGWWLDVFIHGTQQEGIAIMKYTCATLKALQSVASTAVSCDRYLHFSALALLVVTSAKKYKKSRVGQQFSLLECGYKQGSI